MDNNLYYRWRKNFLEAYKTRPSGEIKYETLTSDIYKLKVENMYLVKMVAELSLENNELKKRLEDLK